MSSAQPQINGVQAGAPSAGTPQPMPVPMPGSAQTTAASAQPQPAQQAPQPQQQPSQSQSQPSASAPRPRDARLIELLLTSQGVTAYEQRVPLLLLDFAYRHTSAILSDALHLSGDPYITQAGGKSSGSPAGTVAAPAGDASVSANAVKLAIAARLGFQFRGGSSGGGIGKEYMQELARERNKIALPKIVPNEWGVRLPSERFVLSGTSWGLKDMWDEDDDDDNEDEGEGGDRGDAGRGGGDAMEGIEGPAPEDIGGDGVEGGTIDDVFGDDADAEMADDG
ncbi:Transcription initiation factor TFIID subunit 9 [Escovopsis weberi]|uniref:Transcription initiation factor TFIID subunit 9 n=1 Tax=Escovopsis weberi TaxID=150374 RepID=A0A0M9VT72_ESCWE|nr:Transcription initiation factor TFIID subunit 9 [Escovopsis weberi]